MRNRSLRVSLTALVAAAALVAPTNAAPASAGTNDNNFRVVQHNTDELGPAAALKSVEDFGDVDAVTFQELCDTEAVALRNAGWTVSWRAQRQGDTCLKGNAIATKRGLAAVPPVDLADFGGRDFSMLCAQITGSGIAKSYVCTTHLSIGYGDGAESDGAANRQKQINQILDFLEPKIRNQGWRVALTGDFNAEPDSDNLGKVYRVTNSGTDNDLFWEGDQTYNCNDTDGLCRNMAPTTRTGGRKIDYFLSSWRGVNPNTGLKKSAVVSNIAGQGHKVIRGQVTFQ